MAIHQFTVWKADRDVVVSGRCSRRLCGYSNRDTKQWHDGRRGTSWGDTTPVLYEELQYGAGGTEYWEGCGFYFLELARVKKHNNLISDNCSNNLSSAIVKANFADACLNAYDQLWSKEIPF